MIIEYKKENDFCKFMYEEIGKKIECKTIKNLEVYCHYFILEKELMDKAEELIKKYDLKDFNLIEDLEVYINISKSDWEEAIEKFKFKDSLDKYFMLNYLEQYDKKNSEQASKIEKLGTELVSISTYYSCADFPLSEDDFENIRLDERITYFIIDVANASMVKNIIKGITDKKIEFNHLNIINKEYEINGLLCFGIYSNWNLKEEKILQRCLAKILAESGIISCIYIDKNGKIDKNLKIYKEHKLNGGGFKEDLGKAFRTSWEADFARILNYLNIKWKYRPRCFEIHGDTYMPGFLVNDDIFVDINDYWDSEKSRVKYFREKYNKYKLYTIDPDMMCTLKKMFFNKIGNWESKRIFSRSQILSLVGTQHLEDKTVLNELKIGDSVYLKRDKNNEYDINAVQILNGDGKLLGYISTYWAPIYADKLDVGMEFTAEIKQKDDLNGFSIKVKRSNLDEDIIYDFLTNVKIYS